MTRQELELKAKEFDSKLKRHPMSSEELQNVLCDFVEALRIHDVVGQSEQLPVSSIPEFGSDEWINCCEQMFGGKPKNG